MGLLTFLRRFFFKTNVFEKRSFTISCPSDECKEENKSFPLSVEVDPNGKKTSVLTKRCPNCENLLSIDIGVPLAGTVWHRSTGENNSEQLQVLNVKVIE